jgi:hypothetical protein
MVLIGFSKRCDMIAWIGIVQFKRGTSGSLLQINGVLSFHKNVPSFDWLSDY